ncbi:hypothetical protein ACP179_20580 [Xenorhabdus stockiae]|uniref:hypothetical protein n=1 Tax=Xenorhabdus stockiae TaxID=351614 RepID=UPI003CF10A13
MKITIEIPRAAAEEFSIPLYTVPSAILANFVTDKLMLGLQEMGFPEADVETIITND